MNKKINDFTIEIIGNGIPDLEATKAKYEEELKKYEGVYGSQVKDQLQDDLENKIEVELNEKRADIEKLKSSELEEQKLKNEQKVIEERIEKLSKEKEEYEKEIESLKRKKGEKTDEDIDKKLARYESDVKLIDNEISKLGNDLNKNKSEIKNLEESVNAIYHKYKINEKKVAHDIDEEYKEKQAQEEKEESMVEEATRKEIDEYNMQEDIGEAYREKQAQEEKEESMVEEATRKEIDEYNKQEATRKEIDEYNKQEDIEEAYREWQDQNEQDKSLEQKDIEKDIESAYREKQAQEAQEESLIEEATRKEIEEYNKQEDNNIVEEYRKKKEQGDNEIKSTKLLSIEAVKCSVKDGKIVYQIGGLDESGQPFKINKVVNPTKMTKKEKKEILESVYNDKSNLKNIDIELYRILKESDQLNNTDINKQYIKFVNAMNAHVNLIDNISIEYDLNNLNETDLTRSQKRQLKSVARKNQKNNIARYTKPQSKLQAFLNKFRQKAITAGEEKEQQGEMSREDSIIATYENLHDYDDFSIEDFSKDMQLTDEEKDKLAKYITEQKNKNPRKKFVDTISCKVEVGPIKDSRRGESTERGIGKEPADD